ncbi:ArnT family glycosyltransferase [Hymenobacter sediminicola]|uniref:Glycosyltransferase family 39 protein n=1 Tax=Hymenobacter sediminicola TaxID=2761579 RepID=A0A7G7W730_9BACT|nr:glycosyltransferase family 39 protein [Hymenobacter sediminicola]QNH62173.1 glycosyltransferase family 39 protein [Hymenobacter sediminicola]
MRVSTTWQLWLVRAFFGLLLLTGALLFRDYGVSVDEPVSHEDGAVSGKYIAEKLFAGFGQDDPNVSVITPLFRHRDYDKGVVFELPVAGLGRLLTHGNSTHYFLMRHLLIFLVFMGGVWALYRLIWLRFGHRMVGLLAAALLVLSPRMFAEAFFNGKDIVFMALFTLAIYTLARLFERPTLGGACLHGIATAAAIGVRMPGVILVAFTISSLCLLACFPGPSDSVPRRRLWKSAAVYLAATALAVIVFWPYLWEDPLVRFAQVYSRVSHYNWGYTNLYFGQFVPADQLPWHYIPVWLLITTPLPYSLAALLGLGYSLYYLFRQRLASLRTPVGRLDLLFIGWLCGPILMVIVLRSTLYDGWRHLYFVYPALLLLAVQGLLVLFRAVVKHRRAYWLAISLLVVAGVETARTGIRMVQLHPYEHLYFSFLPARMVEQQFERDYWGLAFRQGLDWVMAHDSAPQVTVASDVPDMVYANVFLLPALEQARLRRVPARSAATARYFIANYRWHPQPYPDSLGPEVYTVRAGGIKILSVFRRP